MFQGIVRLGWRYQPVLCLQIGFKLLGRRQLLAQRGLLLTTYWSRCGGIPEQSCAGGQNHIFSKLQGD